jgi:hypothetical protein
MTRILLEKQRRKGKGVDLMLREMLRDFLRMVILVTENIYDRVRLKCYFSG